MEERHTLDPPLVTTVCYNGLLLGLHMRRDHEVRNFKYFSFQFLNFFLLWFLVNVFGVYDKFGFLGYFVTGYDEVKLSA